MRATRACRAQLSWQAEATRRPEIGNTILSNATATLASVAPAAVLDDGNNLANDGAGGLLADPTDVLLVNPRLSRLGN